MGATHVTVTIRNPAEPERTWEGLFLVDTGATDSLVPRPHLEAIGLAPRGKRLYELADGSELRLDVTVAEIEFMGEIVGGTIIFGEAGVEPLLGVTALESVGIEVDPVSQRLKRLPAVRLKRLASERGDSNMDWGSPHPGLTLPVQDDTQPLSRPLRQPRKGSRRLRSRCHVGDEVVHLEATGSDKLKDTQAVARLRPRERVVWQ